MSLAVLGLLLVASVLFVCYSFSVRNSSQQPFEDHRDRIDLILSQANDCFLDGKVDAAVALTDKAQNEARSEINNPRRRSQILNCAMDYCGYARKDKALAALAPLLSYNDETGRLTKQVFAGMSRGDRMWRPKHIPNPAERAQLKALEARLLNDPEAAKKFVGQYTVKSRK